LLDTIDISGIANALNLPAGTQETGGSLLLARRAATSWRIAVSGVLRGQRWRKSTK
jgi:hypothetical protein